MNLTYPKYMIVSVIVIIEVLTIASPFMCTGQRVASVELPH